MMGRPSRASSAHCGPWTLSTRYVAVRVGVESWRWADVPIVIRAGKRMPVTTTGLSFRFRQPPHAIAGLRSGSVTNRLRFLRRSASRRSCIAPRLRHNPGS